MERVKTAFARAVECVVRSIPEGETLTYGEVAQRAGYKGAARAVGSWLRHNQDLTIPCHRVIRASGGVGEYNRGGSSVKAMLLAEEQKTQDYSSHVSSMLTIGDKAPAFTAKDQQDAEHTLEACAGKWVLLYFYPKDDTPGCTKEACALRDAWRDFTDANALVFGVSKDTIKSHGKFAQKYSLPFPLLADEDIAIAQAYGVWAKKKFMGREYMGMLRWSFLIDPESKIAKVYQDVKPAEHAEEVLRDIRAFQAERG